MVIAIASSLDKNPEPDDGASSNSNSVIVSNEDEGSDDEVSNDFDSAIVSAKGDGESDDSDSATVLSKDSEDDSAPSNMENPTKTFKNGTYLVNKDIDSGLYRATVSDNIAGMAYIERSSGLSMEFDDIIANIILTGDGYVTIKDTDVAVKIQGASLEPIDLTAYRQDIKASVSDGIYLIDYDIKAGMYKVEVTDTMMGIGYVERMSDASMDSNAIIANELFDGNGYVTIDESDFAVKVEGAKLTLQE